MQCEKGWYGVDCSVPSVLASIGEWPEWLRPSHIDVPDSARSAGTLSNLDAVVQKKRPLIYVYDLPPDFNSLLLEVSFHHICNIFPCQVKSNHFLVVFFRIKGRHFKMECVNRMYDHRNATIWTDQLYGAQVLRDV